MLCHTMNEAWKYQGAQHNKVKEQHYWGDPQQYSNIQPSNGRIENTAQFSSVSLLCTNHHQMQGRLGLVVVSSVMDGIFCNAHQKFTCCAIFWREIEL